MDITNDPAATPEQRIEALRAGVADEHFPSWVPESNNHIHTCFSFSPYTPTHAALLARRNGLRVVGSVDHDSIGAAAEMSEATSVLGMGCVTGFEISARLGEGTPLAQRKLNNPDSEGVAYMTVQGVPAPAREKVAEWLAPKRAARLERTLAMADRANAILTDLGLEPFDPRSDMVGISQYANGGGITERHLLAAMASALIRGFGRGPALVQGLDSMGVEIPESLALFEKYHGAADGRIRIDFSVHAEYTCKSHIVKAYSELCREKGGRMHIHLSETAREQRECIERYGKTPAEWFESLGTFDSPTAAAHCVAVTERDRDILKAHGVSVIHNPTSNLKLGSGFAPIRAMMDKGINVTLGTDGTASNNNLNMFEEMHLAEIMHDGYHNDPTLISTSEVLDMATVNGAKLQGRDDTGVLAIGKKADIIALDMSKPHLYPDFDTPALLTCSAQAGDVCMTMVDGNILYENGEFKTLDEDKVRADMQRAVERLYRK